MRARILFAFLAVFLFLTVLLLTNGKTGKGEVLRASESPSYWLVLQRRSNREFLYFGEKGNKQGSILVRKFTVKSGIPGEKPTPLPKLLGREYWIITNKEESSDNPETSPYFLTLDIPVSDDGPFGPEPYFECNGQCNWNLPGYFGLHGVNGDLSRVSPENAGSSGCVRHSDGDITYLYNTLKPLEAEIRYYIEDI